VIPEEGQTVERKESLSLWRGIVEACASFATAQGGRVFIGVTDDGRVVGAQIGKGTLEDLANKIAQNTNPKVVPTISTADDSGKTVVIVEVKESSSKPVYAFERALRRSGRTNQVLSPGEAAEMYLQSRGRTWDYTAVADAGMRDVDPDKVRRFVERARAARRLELKPSTPVKLVLRQLRLVRDNKPSVAGVLLFSHSPTQFLPQATVRCARFKGQAEGTFLDLQVIEGSVIEQVAAVMEFAQRNLAMAAKIEGALERKETWEYPLEALREAVINAVCHRDYASAASVQVRIFDDRLEVWNPGGLPPELSVRDLRVSHASIPRNKLVADVFFLIGYVEQFGTGTQRMIDQLREAGLPEPEFESREHFFRVVFRKSVPVEKRFADSDLNGRQVIALRFLEKSKRITRKEYEKLTGASDVTAKRDLTDLVNKRVLVRRGATRNLWYEVSGHPMTRK
jgi:ATP-dependent DNA helicase RecG